MIRREENKEQWKRRKDKFGRWNQPAHRRQSDILISKLGAILYLIQKKWSAGELFNKAVFPLTCKSIVWRSWIIVCLSPSSHTTYHYWKIFFMYLHSIWRSSGPATTKICCFGILIILSWRHLKNSKHRERIFLSSPYLPEGRSSKRNSIVLNPLPGSFISWRRLTLITEEDTGNGHLTQTNSVPIILPIYSSKHPFIIPQSHSLPLKRPTPSTFC